MARGGKRENAGRKPKTEQEKLETVKLEQRAAYLFPEMWARLELEAAEQSVPVAELLRGIIAAHHERFEPPTASSDTLHRLGTSIRRAAEKQYQAAALLRKWGGNPKMLGQKFRAIRDAHSWQGRNLERLEEFLGQQIS